MCIFLIELAVDHCSFDFCAVLRSCPCAVTEERTSSIHSFIHSYSILELWILTSRDQSACTYLCFIIGAHVLFVGHGGARAAQYCKDHLLNYVLNDPSYVQDPSAAMTNAFIR